MAKVPAKLPVGTFRSSARVTHEKKDDSDDDEPKKQHHEIFTEYSFKDDGTYDMHGYPPIQEKGSATVVEKVAKKVGQDYQVRFTQRVQTSGKGEWKPADISGLLKFSGDLKSFTWDAKMYHSHAEGDQGKEEKKEKKEKK